MAIELVQNHVLIPHPADWSTRPKWRRRWRDAVAAGTRGGEDRTGLAERPLIELTWTISPVEHPEWSRLEDRIRAAIQSGQAASPFHGRGTKLAAEASGTTVTLVSDTWPFQAGDFVYLQTRDRWSWAEYEVAEIDSVAGAVLTLTAALSRSYAAGGFAWPLLFGRLSTSDFPALHNRRGSVQVTLTQLEPFPAEPEFSSALCNVVMDLEDGEYAGDTFDCYEDTEEVTTLPLAGTGFDGDYIVGNSPYGSILGDAFTSYPDGDAVGILNGGIPNTWDGAWIIGPELSTPPPETLPVVEGDFRYFRLLISANNGDANFGGVLELELREEFDGANVVGGGTASASNTEGAFAPSRAFNGLFGVGEGWIYQAPALPVWLQYDFGAGITKRIVQYRVGSYPGTINTAARSSKNWKLQGSNNGTDWTDLHEVTNASGWTFPEMRIYGHPQ